MLLKSRNSTRGLPLLVFGSPAKSLGLQVCHIFCTHVLQVAYFISHFLIVRFNSVSHFRTTQQEYVQYSFLMLPYTCFPFATSMFFHSTGVSFNHKLSQRTQAHSFLCVPLISLFFPSQIPTKQKNAPNLCAYCIGRSHSLKLHSPLPPKLILAVGSRAQKRERSFKSAYFTILKLFLR